MDGKHGSSGFVSYGKQGMDVKCVRKQIGMGLPSFQPASCACPVFFIRSSHCYRVISHHDRKPGMYANSEFHSLHSAFFLLVFIDFFRSVC